MKQRYWLVTDYHLGHDNIKTFCGRPDNFEKLIKNRHNHIVHNNDIVINLGDVSWTDKDSTRDFIKSLKGTHILVRGNHDRCRTDNWFLDVGFTFVCTSFIRNDVVYSHRPLMDLGGATVNVHGHCHNSFDNKIDEFRKLVNPEHYLLSLEYANYTPILIDNNMFKKLLPIDWHGLKREERELKQ